jgi:hypothetical protein
VRAITRAKDRAGALAELMGSLTVGSLPFEPEPLIERGELVYHSLVAGVLGSSPLPTSVSGEEPRTPGDRRDFVSNPLLSS